MRVKPDICAQTHKAICVDAHTRRLTPGATQGREGLSSDGSPPPQATTRPGHTTTTGRPRAPQPGHRGRAGTTTHPRTGTRRQAVHGRSAHGGHGAPRGRTRTGTRGRGERRGERRGDESWQTPMGGTSPILPWGRVQVNPGTRARTQGGLCTDAHAPGLTCGVGRGKMRIQQPKERIMDALFFAPALAIVAAAAFATVAYWFFDL